MLGRAGESVAEERRLLRGLTHPTALSGTSPNLGEDFFSGLTNNPPPLKSEEVPPSLSSSPESGEVPHSGGGVC